MRIHSARAYLPAFQTHLRGSVLGRSMGNKASSLTKAGMSHRGADEDDATLSLSTDTHIRAFLDAWDTGDDDKQKEALSKVAQTWRADNAASGVPVHAHLPLPSGFAKTLAQLVVERDNTAVSPMLAKVIVGIHPSLQTLVAEQIGVLTRSRRGEDEREHSDLTEGQGDAPWLADADAKTRGAIVNRHGAQVTGRPIPSSRKDGERWRTMEYNPSRDGAAGVRTLPWDGQRADAMPFGSTVPRDSSATGMIPGGGTPPVPPSSRKPSPPSPLGPSSDRTFNPDLRRPRPTALGEVSNGGRDRRRRYEVGNTRVDVPINEDEADVVAGLDYVNNLRRPDGSPVVSSFASDSAGGGVTVVGAAGGKVTDGSASQYYSWEYLRAVGRLARSQEPKSPIGARLTWRKPTEKANLEPDWAEAQRRYRRGDGSDAVIDPEPWGVSDDADEFADTAQRAANGEKGFSGNLRQSIAQAQATGEPQFVDILLPGSGPLYGARGLVMGQYAIRVRGVVVVKDGKYQIVGRATIVDAGKFNYDQDGQRNRSDAARWALWATQFLPDPTNTFKYIADPGNDYSIRANCDADVEIWGVVR